MQYRDLNATVRALAPLIIVSLTVLLRVSLVDADAEVARPADAFVDFVGVNTHLGYSDTTYGDYEGILKARLLELGVRHIRDGTFNSEVLRKYLDVGHHGIRLLFITDSKRAVERAQELGPMLYAGSEIPATPVIRLLRRQVKQRCKSQTRYCWSRSNLPSRQIDRQGRFGSAAMQRQPACRGRCAAEWPTRTPLKGQGMVTLRPGGEQNGVGFLAC